MSRLTRRPRKGENMLAFGSLFAGIGGMDLGFERAGMVCKWQVEIDDYATKVLARHWPDVRRWRDVTTLNPTSASGPGWNVDVICGGFPCQDVSTAGKGVGINGSRSGLYAEMLRLVRSLRPTFIVIENVDGLRSNGLATVLRDIAESGYDAEWEVLSACTFGAPHTRERVFIVAYPNGDGLQGVLGRVVEERKEKGRIIFTGGNAPARRQWQQLPAPVFCRGIDGISAKVDRTKALGNAVVPQVAEWIGARLMEVSQWE